MRAALQRGAQRAGLTLDGLAHILGRVAGRTGRVDKRSPVHHRHSGVRWTSLSLVHPTAGIMNNACPVGGAGAPEDGHFRVNPLCLT
jgi:hypothetical protein